MRAPDTIIAQLLRVFPQRHVAGRTAPHECPECSSICAVLDDSTWSEVPRGFLQANPDVLPLLSPAAYRAFLPAWLREGVLDPSGEVAAMVLINLSDSPATDGFTHAEGRAIVDAARYIGETNFWGSTDPINSERVATVNRLWSNIDA